MSGIQPCLENNTEMQDEKSATDETQPAENAKRRALIILAAWGRAKRESFDFHTPLTISCLVIRATGSRSYYVHCCRDSTAPSGPIRPQHEPLGATKVQVRA
jgi:hypothetical protein